jgi:hypothetical protein
LDELRLADLEIDDVDVAVVALSQINAGLEQAKAQPIDGIIGSNFMIERNGIIEYANDALHLRRDVVAVAPSQLKGPNEHFETSLCRVVHFGRVVRRI